MKYLPLLLANLQRKKIRTLLTIGSFVVALFLFGLLAAVRAGFRQGIDVAGADRLVVIGRTGLIQPLPLALLRADPAAARGEGRRATPPGSAGVYQDPKNFFAQFVIEPEDWPRHVPGVQGGRGAVEGLPGRPAGRRGRPQARRSASAGRSATTSR